MSTLELVKNRGACVLSTMSSIHSISSILIKFEQQGFFLNNEKKKKMNNIGPYSLEPCLKWPLMWHVQFNTYFSEALFYFFIDVPIKKAHCKRKKKLYV